MVYDPEEFEDDEFEDVDDDGMEPEFDAEEDLVEEPAEDALPVIETAGEEAAAEGEAPVKKKRGRQPNPPRDPNVAVTFNADKGMKNVRANVRAELTRNPIEGSFLFTGNGKTVKVTYQTVDQVIEPVEGEEAPVLAEGEVEAIGQVKVFNVIDIDASGAEGENREVHSQKELYALIKEILQVAA